MRGRHMTRTIRHSGPALSPALRHPIVGGKNNSGRMINQCFVRELPVKAMQRST